MTTTTTTEFSGGEFPADLLVELDQARPRSLGRSSSAACAGHVGGSLLPGTALPPSRVLAAEIGVSARSSSGPTSNW